MYFLVQAETLLPPDMPSDVRATLIERESAVGREHVVAGRLLHIWRLPGRQANVAVWSCADADELHSVLTSLPAWPWMTITVQPLARHPLTRD